MLYRVGYSLLVLELLFIGRVEALTLYAEQQFVAPTEQWATLLTVRQPVLKTEARWFPYVAAGGERLGAGLFDTTAPSHGYAAPGFAWRFEHGILLTEVRLRLWAASDFQRRDDLDWRVIAAVGRWWESERIATNARPFLEAYGEAVLTSADRWNVIGTAFLRGGLRWKLDTASYVDFFVEPFANVDRVGHASNNRVALRPGVRLGTNWGGLSVALLGHAGPHRYLPRVEQNPHRDAWHRESVLLVVGGEW